MPFYCCCLMAPTRRATRSKVLQSQSTCAASVFDLCRVSLIPSGNPRQYPALCLEARRRVTATREIGFGREREEGGQSVTVSHTERGIEFRHGLTPNAPSSATVLLLASSVKSLAAFRRSPSEWLKPRREQHPSGGDV